MISVETIVSKNKKFEERRCDDFFVLVNNEENVLYCFKKDTKLLWNSIYEESSIYDICIRLGYDESEEKQQIVISLIEEMINANTLNVTNNSYSKNNKNTSIVNKLNEYEKYCNANGKIFKVLVELTNRCNLRCIHCYHDEKINSLKMKQITKMLSDFKNIGVISITYTGGEIFTLKKWRQILSVTKQMGFIVSFISNLILLTEDDIKFINDLNIYIIKTSIYGDNEITHDNITGVKGSYNETMSNIKKLLKHNNVHVNYVITKDNYLQTVNVNKLKNFGINVQFDYKIFPSRSGKKDNLDKYIDKNIFKFLYDKNIVEMPTESKCGAGCGRIRINQQGDVFPCEYLTIRCGNINNDSIDNILKDNKMNLVINKASQYMPEECKVCSYRSKCSRCPALIWNHKPFKNEKHPLMCHEAHFNDVIDIN